jgi:hypothetical protein
MQMQAYTSLHVDMSTDLIHDVSDVGPGHTFTQDYVLPRRPLQKVTATWQEPTDRESTAIITTKMNTPVLTTLRRIDRFTGGFPPSTISLMESQHEFMFNILARIIVNTVNMSNRDVIFVDGGNSLDPYLLTAACRLFRVDADYVLRRVQVARAFTVFQLDTLITQNLERILRRSKPRLVLISCMSELYLDRDVDWHEARVLFESDFKKLQELTEKYKVSTIITNFGYEKSVHRYELKRKLRKWLLPEHRLSIKIPSHNRLRLVKGTGEFLDYLPLPPYQWSLDDFYPGGDICG